MSSQGTAGREGTSRQSGWLRRLRPESRADYLRFGAVAVVVVGGIAIGLAVSGGGQGSAAPGAPPAQAQTPTSVTAPSATATAVSQALAHGSLNVVVDQPSEATFAELNRVIEGGAQVAAEQANSSGQLPDHLQIKLVPESLDALSPSAIQERLRSDGAGVLVLPCDTNSQARIAAAVAHYGTLMIATCNPEPLAAERYSTYWAVGSAGNEEAAELASFMVTQGYLRTFVLKTSGLRYAELLTGYFERAAKSKNIHLVGSASVSADTQDFSALAQQIKGIEPQPTAVFTALPPPTVNRLGAALRAQGVNTSVVGTSVMDSHLTLTGTEALENAIFASYGFPREGGAAEHYASDYAKQFGKPPVGSLPNLGYETVRLLEEAAREAHSGEPSAIAHVLAGGFTLHGVALADRHYLPGSDHNPVSEVGIAKITGSAIEPLIAASPSAVPSP